jgi:esterase
LILNVVEAGEGSPVALLHGLFGAAQNLRDLQRRLAVRHRVLALDLRNHGASPHAAGMDYAIMAADVMETLANHDALPAALLGHSMGGKVAMQAALAEPERVARLVVADIAPVAYPPHFRAYAAAMRSVPLEPGLSRTAADAALAPAIPDKQVRGFLLQNLRTSDCVPAWRCGLDEIIAGLPEIEGWESPAGGRYDGPVWFIGGERSDYILPEHRAVIRSLFPRSRFVTVKGAGHWLHSDQPEAFAGIVEAALSASRA